MTKDRLVDPLPDGGLVFIVSPYICLEEDLDCDCENVIHMRLYRETLETKHVDFEYLPRYFAMKP